VAPSSGWDNYAASAENDSFRDWPYWRGIGCAGEGGAMIREMRSTGPPLTRADIEKVEREIGRPFPPEYLSFLLKYNGGRPRPNGFPIAGLEGNPFGTIHTFFGIGRSAESTTLSWNVGILSDRLPSRMIPIGHDESDNIICLLLEGDRSGSVWFWDSYASHVGDGSDPPGFYPIAETFEKFLELIGDF
jgi:hypothetical protein